MNPVDPSESMPVMGHYTETESCNTNMSLYGTKCINMKKEERNGCRPSIPISMQQDHPENAVCSILR